MSLKVKYKKLHIQLFYPSGKPPIKVEDSIAIEKRIPLCEPPYPTESLKKRRATSAYGSPPGPKQAVPKSLTVSQIIRLGKLIKPCGDTVVIDIYPFDFNTLSWSMLHKKVEFAIRNEVLGQGGFQKAFKASNTSWFFRPNMGC